MHLQQRGNAPKEAMLHAPATAWGRPPPQTRPRLRSGRPLCAWPAIGSCPACTREEMQAVQGAGSARTHAHASCAQCRPYRTRSPPQHARAAAAWLIRKSPASAQRRVQRPKAHPEHIC